MITFTLSAPLKLMSLNQAFSTLRNGRRVKSKEYVLFEKEIKTLMSARIADFKAFNDAYSPSNNEIHVHLLINTPNLYTKDGRISERSGDIDNSVKTLFDNVFVGDIDDSQVTYLLVRKKYATVYSFTLQLKIANRE